MWLTQGGGPGHYSLSGPGPGAWAERVLPQTLWWSLMQRGTCSFGQRVCIRPARFFLQCEAHLGYRLQLIPVAAIPCYAPSSTV